VFQTAGATACSVETPLAKDASRLYGTALYVLIGWTNKS